MKNKTICVIRNDQIGDVACTLPFIQNIKIQWPTSYLIVIAKPLTSPIFQQVEAVDEVINDIQLDYKKNKWLLFKQIVVEFKKRKIDYIFFPKMDPLYVWAAFIAGIPERVGDGQQLLMRPLLTRKVPLSWHDFTKHEVLQQMRLMEPFIGEKNIPRVLFKQDENVMLSSRRLLNLDSDQMYIVIHPTFGKGNRGWGVDNYAQLIDLVHNETPYKVVLSGGVQDKVITDVIQEKATTSIINISGKASIKELLYIIKNSQVVIGAETGPLHLAAICHRPIISISPTKYTSPFRWGPLTANHVVIKQNNDCKLVCNTYKNNCNKDFCITPIRVKDVFQSFKFISNQKIFPENNLYYWIKTSATIAIHIDEVSEEILNQLEKILALLKSVNCRYFISTTSPQTYKKLGRFDSSVFLESSFKLHEWSKKFAISGVIVWHCLSIKSQFWRRAVQKLIALKIDREPVFVDCLAPIDRVQDLFDIYIEYSQNLSRSVN